MIKCVITGKSFFHLDFNCTAARTALLFISITSLHQYYRDNLLYKCLHGILQCSADWKIIIITIALRAIFSNFLKLQFHTCMQYHYTTLLSF